MEFKTLLSSLTAADVEFVIIGGLAATLHGSARGADVIRALPSRRSAKSPLQI
jgi:hypothetical protein